ncbi:sensor domain-containing diguanylate cyclase [Colwellia sp. 75C3]|uniref:sensor domain-containing diguanylate cyclase n=1 Tax=Colwellia sp. 75C3 TaxID=888425 RepID=UPI000C349887|nr:GGDEF domain-containing protein [Colwellia sp. 75C3]PKG81380.1 sensor domain-containing diguanylate cyclase [Colwellia sp. 75C3]
MSITELSNKAQLLKDAERRSHHWLENSPVCTKIVDPNFNLQYMSESGVKSLCIFDILPYYGQPYPLDFYPQSFRTQMIETIKHARHTKETVTQEAAVVDLNGDEVWFHSTIVPVYDENHQLEYYMIVSIDITDRKSAEIKLHQMNSELESLVAKRTKALEEANKQLKISSETDFLTKLSNRLFYERRLCENISTAKRNDTYLSLLMIDIDNFKIYNDEYGHDNGDITLCSVAQSIADSLPRATDLVSRFGGEEFVVLLPETDATGAFAIAERIRKNIEALAIKYTQSDTGVVTVSIGIEALKAGTLNKIDLFKHADIALYTAKDNGRNCTKLFSLK